MARVVSLDDDEERRFFFPKFPVRRDACSRRIGLREKMAIYAYMKQIDRAAAGNGNIA